MSSVAVFDSAMSRINKYAKITTGKQINFYMNLHLKDGSGDITDIV